MPLAIRMREAAAGATASALISDTFTRANSSTSMGTADTGQAWSPLTGTWGISSNAALNITHGNGELASITAGVTNMTVSAAISSIAAANSFAGIVARMTDASNFYLADVTQVGQPIRLFKCVGGAFTSLGSAGSGVDGAVLQLAVTGTAIVVTYNGSVIISTTDSALTTGTKAGLRYGNNAAATTDVWDNFTVTSP